MYKNYLLAGILILISYIACAENKPVPADGMKEEVNIYREVYDAPLLTPEGTSTLSRLAKNKPLILALIFTRCSNICYPFLLNLKEELQFGEKEGSYQVFVVSFDAADSLSDVMSLAKRLGLQKEQNWLFGVTPAIDELNRSIGFRPVWDASRQQFDHDALLVGINQEGYITKKLIGIRNSNDLRLLVRSINNQFSPSYRLPGQNLLFSCFNYNPETGKNTPGTGLLFIALPAILATGILVGVRLWVKRSD